MNSENIKSVEIQILAQRISTALHDMSQPLATLQASIELAMMFKDSEKEKHENYLQQSLTMMERVSGDFGLLSRIIGLYKTPSTRSTVRFGDLVLNQLDETSLGFQEKNVRVTTQDINCDLTVDSDPDRLRELVFVLLQICISSCQSGGTLKTSLSEFSGSAELELVEELQDPKSTTEPVKIRKSKLGQLYCESSAESIGAKLEISASPLRVKLTV